MTLFRVRDGRIDREWDGELVAETSTSQAGSRWAEIKLYRLADSKWLVHRTGYSLIYHTGDTTCETANGRPSGVPAFVDDLPDDAEPCPRCQPPDPQDLLDDEPVRFEAPRHIFDTCATAAEVVNALTTYRKRGPDGKMKRVRRVSEPAGQILDAARLRVPEFAELPRPAERIA